MQIAKNNSSILNNGFLPSITINGDANTNSQDIEIETPSGLSGTLKTQIQITYLRIFPLFIT